MEKKNVNAIGRRTRKNRMQWDQFKTLYVLKSGIIQYLVG
jgi:hypothetical protein